MDITRLRTLVELARCGTMAAAATALHLTPSAVSQQLTQLEQEAGVPLTERRGRGVTLTPAGLALVAHAERILAILGEAKAELAALHSAIAGELRVAAFPSIAVALMPETVRRLRLAYPRLQVIVEEREPQESLTALGAWRIDVAVIDDLAVAPSSREQRDGWVPLAHDTLHVLLPAEHALANQPSLTVAELRDEPWALDSTASSFGEFLIRLCQQAGFTPRLQVHCTGFEMVAAMVAAGNAVSIVSGLRLVRPSPGVRAVPLSPTITRGIGLAYRPGEQAHPAIRVFVETVVAVAREIVPEVGQQPEQR